MPHLLDEKNVKMLTAHNVYSEPELQSRCEIMLENYCKTVVIEANTMVDMAKRQILPAIEGYAADIAKTAAAKKSVDSDIPCTYEKELLKKLSVLTDQIAVKTDELDEAVMKVKALSDVEEEAYGIRDNVLSKMSELRAVADEAETMMSEKYWPFPTYGELLFGVR